MEKTNAQTPRTASGQPNIGFFVGLNLPIYHKKLAAGVQEARARAAADAQLFEAELDQAHRDIKDFFVQAKVQQNVLALLRRNNLPAAKQVLELTASDYRAGNVGVDYLTLFNALRDHLQVELQIAQIEAELGKTLASLERAVGAQLNEHPPLPPAPAPTESASPFRRENGPLIPTERNGAPSPPGGSAARWKPGNDDGRAPERQKAGTTPEGGGRP